MEEQTQRVSTLIHEASLLSAKEENKASIPRIIRSLHSRIHPWNLQLAPLSTLLSLLLDVSSHYPTWKAAIDILVIAPRNFPREQLTGSYRLVLWVRYFRR